MRRISSKLLDSASSASMNVDGSVTPVEFTFTGREGATRLITEVVLTLHSTAMDLSSAAEMRIFGSVGSTLSNGLRLFVNQSGLPVAELDLWTSPVVRMVDFYRYGDVSGHVDSIAAGTDQLVVTFSWPVEAPLTLRRGTDDYLSLKVSDNLTSLGLFEGNVYGWATS